MHCLELGLEGPTMGFALNTYNTGYWFLKFPGFEVPLVPSFKELMSIHSAYEANYRGLVKRKHPTTSPTTLLKRGHDNNVNVEWDAYEPRPHRLWKAGTASNRNKLGRTQLIPFKGTENGRLLVRARTQDDADGPFYKGTFKLPGINVKEAVAISNEGDYTHALFILDRGQQVTLDPVKSGKTIYNWDGRFLYMVRVVEGAVTEERYEVEDLIDAERDKDGRAYNAIADMAKDAFE